MLSKYISNPEYSQFIATSRYARWLPEEKRRETWAETAFRYSNYWAEEGLITDEQAASLFDHIHSMQVMPSMRALMVAGEALRRSKVAQYNCAYLAINSPKAFDETLFILMNGTGVGFSCERQYVNLLPTIAEHITSSDTIIMVEDSKEGWAYALRELISMLYAGTAPKWDVSKVRPAGTPLKVFGGRASGPGPLVGLFKYTTELFRSAAGRKLNSLEVHGLVCKIAEIVVVGGVRRAALISLSNLSDQRMRHAKSGQWWVEHPEYALANNSIAYTEKPDGEAFMREWLALVESKSGERGIFNRVAAKQQAAKNGRRDPDHDWGCNPCVPGETLILTDRGHIPIRDVVGIPTNIWNGSEWSEVEPFHTGRKKIYEVKLSDGSTLTCTGNHKFVLADGYTGRTYRSEVDELNIGDKLAKFDMPVVIGGEDYPVDAYSQGFYSGDGNFGLRHSWLYSTKYACESRLIGTFGSEHDSVARKTWKHGLMLPKGFVPINGSLDYCLNWIAGLLDSDGTVTRDKNGNGFQIAAIDNSFLQGVKLMLARAGVQAKIVAGHEAGVRSMPDGRGGVGMYPCQTGYRLLVGNSDVYRLGKLGLRTERLVWHKNPPQRDARQYTSVVSITAVGDDDVYCFNEPINHTGTFNGVVTGQCSEILLRPDQFCNLTSVMVRPDDTVDDLAEKVSVAAILGTLQATQTKFHYLSDSWQHNTEEEALLGVSLTGVMDNPLLNNPDDPELPARLERLRDVAVTTNAALAAQLGINQAAGVTCIKPEGTVSQLTDTASGIHPRYAPYYIRTVRADAKDPMAKMMQDAGFPCEPDVMKPDSTLVFSFPMKAPEGSVFRDDRTALQQLDLWLIYQRHWCEHKPSITVYVRDHEWMEVGAWVYKRFDEVSGVSFLPHSDHTYQQAPYQEMSEAEYNAAVQTMPKGVDWTQLSKYELEDRTTSSQTLACTGGGVCELVDI